MSRMDTSDNSPHRHGNCVTSEGVHTLWGARTQSDMEVVEFHRGEEAAVQFVRSDSSVRQIWLPDMIRKLLCGRVLDIGDLDYRT